MSAISHYLFLGVDYLLTFLLVGLGQVWNVMPRVGETQPKIPDTPGFRMVQQMGVGWNLANTLESFYQNDTGVETETSWGNPVTTQAMLDMVKDAGFTCVRIPTTWGNHVDENNTIDPAWMNRVQEVVDYAYGIGLYVILNTHNDDHYEYIPDKEHEESTAAAWLHIWAQIATRFKDYDERLLFESINEPKVVGHEMAWRGGMYSHRKAVNRLNAAFVQTVRASGGNNATRWLMLPTHAASYEPMTMAAMKLPNDDRLIVSIHAYYPWKLTDSQFPDIKTYGEKEKEQLETMLGRIYNRFVKKGIPVYLGEFGLVDKNNKEDRVRYTSDYVKTARRYGMNLAWWDNGLTANQEFNGASFQLLDRRKMQWAQPEIVAAIMEGRDNP